MSRTSATASSALVVGLLLVGCGGSDSPGASPFVADGGSTGGAAGSGGRSGDCASMTTTALADGQNYHFTGSLDIQAYPIAELGDPLLDWSAVTADLQGHALDPATDLDYSAIIVFNNLTQDEIEARLSTNTLDQSSITAYVSLDLSGARSAHLSEYTLFGNDIDIETYFRQDYGVWLLTLATGATPGAGTRMAAFLQPDPAATAAGAQLTNDSTRLLFTADLHSLQKPAVPGGIAGITVDWSSVTLKGDGSAFAAGDVDQVMLAHYPSMTTAALEDQFLDVELLADDLWTGSVTSGTGADLSWLQSSKGPFTGIDDQGLWLLALRCSTCTNPAPPYLTILQTCP